VKKHFFKKKTTESNSNLVGKKKISISTYGLKMGNNKCDPLFHYIFLTFLTLTVFPSSLCLYSIPIMKTVVRLCDALIPNVRIQQRIDKKCIY
jgi:hypothetical protein